MPQSKTITVSESELTHLIKKTINESQLLLEKPCNRYTCHSEKCTCNGRGSRGGIYQYPSGKKCKQDGQGGSSCECSCGPGDWPSRSEPVKGTEKYNVRPLGPGQIVPYSKTKGITMESQLLNEERTCREQWGGCMESIGHVARGRQICDDDWCDCEGLGGGCSGMVGPDGPTLDDRIQIRESELVNLIKRTIVERQELTEVQCPCFAGNGQQLVCVDNYNNLQALYGCCNGKGSRDKPLHVTCNGLSCGTILGANGADCWTYNVHNPRDEEETEHNAGHTYSLPGGSKGTTNIDRVSLTPVGKRKDIKTK